VKVACQDALPYLYRPYSMDSEAHSAASDSPRSAMSDSRRRIIDRKMPRLRWVGSTLTSVTPATGTTALVR
jgi:hypothetical protein